MRESVIRAKTQQTHFQTRTQRGNISSSSSKENCAKDLNKNIKKIVFRLQCRQRDSAFTELFQQDNILAENRLGVQTRSMVDAPCNEDQTANPPEQQPVPDATNNPASTTENPNTNPQNLASNPTVELTRMETT